MSMERYIETLIHFASTGEYEQEVLLARGEYFEKQGEISEEEDKYEDALRGFIDWYVFDRPLFDAGMPPVEVFYDRFHRTFNEEDEKIYSDFRKSFQSLFIVKKSDDTGVHIRDLLHKKKYYVEDEVPRGFFKDEIFQVRLIPFQGGYRFGDFFCFHPLQVNKIILKKAKQIDGSNPDNVLEFLADLLERHRNHERYKHLDATRFYQQKD